MVVAGSFGFYPDQRSNKRKDRETDQGYGELVLRHTLNIGSGFCEKVSLKILIFSGYRVGIATPILRAASLSISIRPTCPELDYSVILSFHLIE